MDESKSAGFYGRFNIGWAGIAGAANAADSAGNIDAAKYVSTTRS